jgi:hypothetical protein
MAHLAFRSVIFALAFCTLAGRSPWRKVMVLLRCASMLRKLGTTRRQLTLRHRTSRRSPTHFGIERIARTSAGDAVDQDRRHRRQSQLQPIYSGQRQHPLKNRRQAD